MKLGFVLIMFSLKETVDLKAYKNSLMASQLIPVTHDRR